jgi:alkylation response protein AidB-like acyl-CoA dehydrogenase
MDFAFNEEQEELREIARGFLAEFSGSEQVRAAMASELGYEPELWKQLGVELGWTSLMIPEEYGGLGLSYVELVALLEIMGGSLLCSPFFASICLGANALLTGGTEAQKQEHLPGIAEGRTRATLAYMEANGRYDASGIEAVARPDGSDFILTGEKTYVVDGHVADLIVVAARLEGSSGEDGLGLFLVDGKQPGVTRRALATMDQTRRQANIRLDGVHVPKAAVMGEVGGASPTLAACLQRAAIALAAEQVGGAQRCLELSVDYAKEREQFGRPIGSFQAIKHKCADMMLLVESARSAAYYGGCVVAEDSPELATVAALAKAYCSDAYFRCAADAIQIHGGVGFTWEYDIHLYFKRARSSEILLGDPAHHRELVAGAIGL